MPILSESAIRIGLCCLTSDLLAIYNIYININIGGREYLILPCIYPWYQEKKNSHDCIHLAFICSDFSQIVL